MSVECPDSTGLPEAHLFIKIADRSELDRYELVEGAGVAVPRLLATIPRGNEEIVLVFEFLDTIGIDARSFDEVAELLSLVAQINSVAPSSVDVPAPPSGQPDAEFTESVRSALLDVTEAGIRSDVRVDAWLTAYSATRQRASSMPHALTHGELYFQQVGRRSDGPLVVFDFATLGRRPRFADVCNVVGPLAAAMAASETDVFQTYLLELKARGVAVPATDEAFLELRWLRVLTRFESLPWLASSHAQPELGPGHLAQHLAALHRDLLALHALP